MPQPTTEDLFRYLGLAIAQYWKAQEDWEEREKKLLEHLTAQETRLKKLEAVAKESQENKVPSEES